jgi:hypothetical protein
MSDGRGGTWGTAPAPTSEGGGYEYAQHTPKEHYGASYDMVMSDKSGQIQDRQDPHYLGNLLPPAHSRSDEARSFFDATSVMG